MLELLGMDFEIPYAKEPFYAALFLIAVVILVIGYLNRKKANFKDDSEANMTFGSRSTDVLGQPIQSENHDQFPKEGVLFNTGANSNFFQSLLTVLGAFILFGLIVNILK